MGEEPLVLLDDELVPQSGAVISAFDRGVMFGESVFETVKVEEGAPCLWGPHRDRLSAACRTLGIPLDLPALEEGVRALLAARPVSRGALRVQVTGGVQPGGGRGLAAPAEDRTPRVIGRVDPLPEADATVYEEGVDAMSTLDLCRPLPWLKSGSYLASVAARTRAEGAGVFECLFAQALPGGGVELLEGAVTSLIGFRGEDLVQPPGGILPGVTAGVALREAVRRGRETSEEPVTYSLAVDEGLLLTSSLLGICAVASLDGRILPDRRRDAAELAGFLRSQEVESRRRWIAAAGGRSQTE